MVWSLQTGRDQSRFTCVDLLGARIAVLQFALLLLTSRIKMNCNNQLLGIALVLIGIGGCSKPPADLAKASGLVTLDGVPVPEAKIMFHPVAGGARTSYGTTNEKGEFKASTFGMYDGAANRCRRGLLRQAIDAAESKQEGAGEEVRSSRGRQRRGEFDRINRWQVHD